METAFQFFGFEFLVWFLALCAIAFIALIVGAVWLHGDAQRRGMDATVWVILLVVATVFGNVLGFIIVLVAYLIVRENHPIGGMPPPYGYAPPQMPLTAPVPAPCPVCGNPMTWYAQYQRWYCHTCAQYR